MHLQDFMGFFLEKKKRKFSKFFPVFSKNFQGQPEYSQVCPKLHDVEISRRKLWTNLRKFGMNLKKVRKNWENLGENAVLTKI